MRFRAISLWLLVAWCSLVVLVECQYEGPIVNVKRGHEDRVEYIKAEIQPQHLDTGTPTNPRVRAYARRMMGDHTKRTRDDAGHLIAQRLGGTGREPYNIVPQNMGSNRGSWKSKVEQRIYDEVKNGNPVTFVVSPKYRTPTDTRPYKLGYKATRPDGSILKMGTHPNPPYGGRKSGGASRRGGRRG